MNWQNLKNNLSGFFSGLNTTIGNLLSRLARPLDLFRFLVILLVVDFMAFMALTRSSYLQLLNPVQFLWAGQSVGLEAMELYFPRSLSLTGIEQIYPDEDNQPAKPGAKSGAVTEKPLDAAAIAEETILIRKRVAPAARDYSDKNLSAAENKARRVMLELIAGPAGELETLKARNLLKEPLFLRAIWSHSGTIYLSTEKIVWDKMTGNEKKITEYCILESLKKNLRDEKFALLKE